MGGLVAGQMSAIERDSPFSFRLGAGSFVRLDYFAMAEPRPATDLYAYFGGKAGTGYQGSHIVGGKEKQERATGRASSANNPADKTAFPFSGRKRVPAPKGGAGADRPGGGEQRLIA